MKRVVVLSGAGISAESGIKTFRDAGGLWEEHDIMEVASYEGWKKNPELVIRFYNARRKQLFEVEPNKAHLDLVKLEKKYHVDIVTQNVDDLHERAGSTHILHLHGELKKVRSTLDEKLIYELSKENCEIQIGDTCEKGSQLRPHIVWFGESVPMIAEAVKLTELCDIFIVIGTSLNVYPAASLLNYTPYNAQKYIIDPHDTPVFGVKNLKKIMTKATEGVAIVVEELLKSA
ncbi:MAG: NAD-dependent deacylase [Bacteroidales bacterium]|nr:NAD-dependent deacylase [Bacteroidales bacterium]